jgi:hypothetical protein
MIFDVIGDLLTDLRAKPINRAFRKMWDISDEFIRETRPTMRDLVTHVWGKNLYDVPADQFEEEKRVEAVRKGTAFRTEMGHLRILDAIWILRPTMLQSHQHGARISSVRLNISFVEG